jgi:hypothetical protein
MARTFAAPRLRVHRLHSGRSVDYMSLTLFYHELTPFIQLERLSFAWRTLNSLRPTSNPASAVVSCEVDNSQCTATKKALP